MTQSRHSALNVTRKDFVVHNLDKVEPAYATFNGTMYAGRLPANNIDAVGGVERTGDTMFWMFEPTEQSVPDTLVIWLNGGKEVCVLLVCPLCVCGWCAYDCVDTCSDVCTFNGIYTFLLLFDFLPSHLSFFYIYILPPTTLGPGCSSFNCGVMMEHSPVTQPLKPAGYCCIKGNPGLEQNAHTWTRATTMLYIEHPWGTGFSYGKPEPKTEYEASGDLYAFVQNFFTVFPHLHEHKLYVFGESYAGMFIPSIVRYFHHANLRKNNPFVNIAGGAMVRENHLYIA